MPAIRLGGTIAKPAPEERQIFQAPKNGGVEAKSQCSQSAKRLRKCPLYLIKGRQYSKNVAFHPSRREACQRGVLAVKAEARQGGGGRRGAGDIPALCASAPRLLASLLTSCGCAGIYAGRAQQLPRHPHRNAGGVDRRSAGIQPLVAGSSKASPKRSRSPRRCSPASMFEQSPPTRRAQACASRARGAPEGRGDTVAMFASA